jgi:hypothetical protein
LGRKELFEGLYIEDKWDWDRRNPIVKISFSSIGHKTMGLETAIQQALDQTAKEYGISFTQTVIDQKFKELIEILHAQRGKVVVLIDEYDKPIIDYLGTPDVNIALENRDILKSFYSILKKVEVALQQIKDKGYLMPYLHTNKTCIGIGLNFSKKLKKVEKIVWEKF